jgi:hypothetical protein
MNSDTLFERRDQLKSTIDGLKAELKDIEQQISDTFLDRAKQSLMTEGKDFGTAHILAGNRKVKAVLRKKVTWDQEALRKALDTMPVDDARHYGKLTFSVEERKYNEAPPRVKELLEECRTVELGGATFSVES